MPHRGAAELKVSALIRFHFRCCVTTLRLAARPSILLDFYVMQPIAGRLEPRSRRRLEKGCCIALKPCALTVVGLTQTISIR